MLKSMVELDLGLNSLSGSMPSEIGLLTTIQRIDLHNNQLVSTIPASLGALTSLTYLDLSNNGLTGRLPLTLCNLVGTLLHLDVCVIGSLGCPYLTGVPKCLIEIPDKNFGNLPWLDITMAPHQAEAIPSDLVISEEFPYAIAIVLAVSTSLPLLFLCSCIYYQKIRARRLERILDNIDMGNESIGSNSSNDHDNIDSEGGSLLSEADITIYSGTEIMYSRSRGEESNLSIGTLSV
jgi:hypothetical protein